MISDDPDEDADGLDDTTLLSKYLDIEPEPSSRDTIPDWPFAAPEAICLSLDIATVAWFRSRHADWRSQMHFVLRAWVTAQTLNSLGD